MILHASAWLSIAPAVLASLAHNSPNETRLSCLNAVDATAFSFIYSLPLLSWRRAAVVILGSIGSNTVYSQRQIITPTSNSVVSPNQDTLYSTILVDLSSNDLVITAPNITDGRYWDYAFIDPYGNNFANIGSVSGSRSGKYLLRMAKSDNEIPGLSKSNNMSVEASINMPTAYGFLLGRIYLKEASSADIATVNRYQDELTITKIPRSKTAEALTINLLNTLISTSSPLAQQLELLSRLAPSNPPIVSRDATNVYSTLARAGLYNGQYHPQPGVSLTSASAAANRSIATASAKPQNLIDLGNGWYTDSFSIAGNFGTDYAYRAAIGLNLYLMLTPEQAIYPRHRNFDNGMFVLAENRSLLLTFTGVPPVDEVKGGFWSLTAYNEAFGLVANSLNRYSIGSRSELTFGDGRVQRPVSSISDGGNQTFQILMQAANRAPPSNWTTNWLPTTAAGGKLNFNLRFYVPSPAFTNGSYAYPTVEEIDAFV